MLNSLGICQSLKLRILWEKSFQFFLISLKMFGLLRVNEILSKKNYQILETNRALGAVDRLKYHLNIRVWRIKRYVLRDTANVNILGAIHTD